MARKNTLLYPVLNQSLAASFTSTPTIITYLDNISIQINITTTNSTGTFSIQGSNDYARTEPSDVVSNAGNWVDLTLSGTPTVAAANDSIIIDMNQLPFTAIRIKYTSTIAGTGHCDMYTVARQLGG